MTKNILSILLFLSVGFMAWKKKHNKSSNHSGKTAAGLQKNILTNKEAAFVFDKPEILYRKK